MPKIMIFKNFSDVNIHSSSDNTVKCNKIQLKFSFMLMLHNLQSSSQSCYFLRNYTACPRYYIKTNEINDDDKRFFLYVSYCMLATNKDLYRVVKSERG